MSTQNVRFACVPKPARVVMLMLSVMLLVLLITYAMLEYVLPEPAVALAPATATSAAEATVAAPTPTATEVEPTATATEAEPTATVMEEPTATATEEPSPTNASEENATWPVEGTEVALGNMETADEEARPVKGPTPTGQAPQEEAVPAAPVETSGNVLVNPDFDSGFQDSGVAQGWTDFNNSGAVFSYRQDDWPRVTAEGGQTQIIRILNAEQVDRYAGIYQTVNVVPGQVYTFSINGLVRTNTGDVAATSFGYRMEVGFDPNGGQDWQAVQHWTELPWDEQLRLLDEYRIDRFATTVTAEKAQMTVFVRAWKKWADAGEGAFDVDSIALTGALPVGYEPGVQSMPVTGEPTTLFGGISTIITMALLLLLVGGTAWRIAHKRA